MYKLTRKDAAKKLWVSTRSVDRYIKSGKIRSKKDWKIVYVNNSDIENMTSWWKKQEVIVEKKYKKTKESPILNEDEVFKKEEIIIGEKRMESTKNENVLDNIYNDLRFEIKSKDTLINELSIRLWRAEEISKNSVNILDYKKSQFLLEESRNYLNNEIEDLKVDKMSLEKKLRYEKSSNIVLIFICIVLFAVAAVIWFLEI